jgi:hypothetical protein
MPSRQQLRIANVAAGEGDAIPLLLNASAACNPLLASKVDIGKYLDPSVRQVFRAALSS